MLLHRLVGLCFLPYTNIEGLQIDHINRNTQDNSAENLRWVTPSQNCRNNGYTNITKHGNGYEVRFTKGGKYIFQKYFSTLEEATAARDAFKLTDEYKL
jgi:hemin uptake protein HemP